jgi:hypothetical protein
VNRGRKVTTDASGRHIGNPPRLALTVCKPQRTENRMKDDHSRREGPSVHCVHHLGGARRDWRARRQGSSQRVERMLHIGAKLPSNVRLFMQQTRNLSPCPVARSGDSASRQLPTRAIARLLEHFPALTQAFLICLFTHHVHPVYPCSLLFQEIETWIDRMDRMPDANQ